MRAQIIFTCNNNALKVQCVHWIKIKSQILQHPLWTGEWREEDEKQFWSRKSGWESHGWLLSAETSDCQRGQKRAAWVVGSRAAETEQAKTLCRTWRSGSIHGTTTTHYWPNSQPPGTVFKTSEKYMWPTCIWKVILNLDYISAIIDF